MSLSLAFSFVRASVGVVSCCPVRPRLPRRDRRRIFVKFERGSNAEKGLIEGSGIGLTFANEIVKAHGGSIRYTALKPRGSRFSVFLPK